MIRRPFLTAAVAAALYATVLVGDGLCAVAQRARDAGDGAGHDAAGGGPRGGDRDRRSDPAAAGAHADHRGPRARAGADRRADAAGARSPRRRRSCPTCPSPRPRLTTPARRARPARRTRRSPPGGSDGGQTTDPAAPDEGQAEAPGRQHGNPQAQGEGEGARGEQTRSTPRNPGRNLDGTPTLNNPTFSLSRARRRPDRRPELLHRQVPDPALPALDLPGRRHPVRHPLGGPRGDQRDRDRLRPQPERLLGRRRRLDAVHAGHLEDVRRRRQPRRQEGPVQPGRRDLRGRALPARRGRRAGHPQGDLRLQPRRLVRRLRPPARAGDRRAAEQPRRLADRPHAGPLPRRREGHLRRRPLRARHQAHEGQGQQGRRGRVRHAAPRDQDLRARRARP